MIKLLSENYQKIRIQSGNLLNLHFVRDAFMLQWGSFWDLGLSLVASIIYARLLGVGTYGEYALIFALSGFIGLFMDWGTGYATLTLLAEAYARKSKENIRDIITYFFKLNILVTSTFGLMAIFIAPALARLFYHNTEIGQLARLVIISSIFNIFFSLLSNLLQVMRKIKYLTIIENVSRLFAILLPIMLVIMGFGLRGIVWGYLIAIIGSMIISIIIYRNFARRNNLVPSFKEIFNNFSNVKIKKYFNFGLILAMDKNISSLFGILPLLILGYLATSSDVANLKVALAYLALPGVFLTPISRLLQVQLPKAKVAGTKDLMVNFNKSALYTGIIFIFIMIGFLICAPFLIILVYGQEFSLSLRLVYPLSAGVIISGFFVGYGSIYRTINKNLSSIAINLASIFSGFTLLLIALRFISPLESVVIMIIYWYIIRLLCHYLYIRNYFLKLHY